MTAARFQSLEFSQPRAATWIPAIDGLRALCVIAVVAHHANSAAFSGWALGNVGVAVFFSISGFFAYYVLWHDEQKRGRIDYNFYLTRRTLRIWPTYFVVIFAASALYHAIPTAALFTFTLNLEMGLWREWPLSGLAPLWSIAVEEQFYLVAPLFYLALRSRHAAGFIVVVFAASNLARGLHILFANHASGNGGLYYMTYSYGDTFLGGAIVAHLHLRGWRASQPLLVAVMGFAALVGITLTWKAFPPYTWTAALPYSMLPLAGALVTVACLSDGLLARVLATVPMRAIGRLSYSIYLVHLLVLNGIGGFFAPESVVAFNFAAGILIVVLAFCLYIFVEWPFLIVKSALTSGLPWPSAIVLSIGAVATGLMMLAFS